MTSTRNTPDRRILDLQAIRPDYWLLDEKPGVLSNSPRTGRPRRKVILGRRAPGDPVQQYYCVERTHRRDCACGICRFLDSRAFTAAVWAGIIVAALYFGQGIVRWMLG